MALSLPAVPRGAPHYQGTHQPNQQRGLQPGRQTPRLHCMARDWIADRPVKGWDAPTGQELLALKGGGWSVAFSPDGKRLASASGKEVKLWDAQTGQELLALKGGWGGVSFSPDGQRLA